MSKLESHIATCCRGATALRLACVIAMLLFVLGALLARNVSAGGDLGAIRLADVDGKHHVVTDFVGRGQWVLVNIWGPRCPPCVEEMPELGAFHDAHSEGAAMVLGIALDFPSFGQAKPDEVRAFMDDFLIDFPVLLADHTVFERLSGGRVLRAVPTSLLYRPDGSLALEHVGTLTQEALESYLARHDPRFGARR